VALLTGLSLAIAPLARAAEPYPVPIGSKTRRGQAFPSGDRIELSLQQAIVFALENTLDLDVASYTFERSGFGIGSAQGAFDPFVELDLNASGTQIPVTSSIQASETKRQSANAFFGGLLPFGTTYQAGWTNVRNDSAIPGFTTINPTYTSNLSLSATQPLLRNFGATVNERFIVQARYLRDQNAWQFAITVRDTVQKVENAYWDLAYAIANLKAKQEALDRAGDVNHITKVKIDVGALAPIDIVQTEVTIAQREQDIILAEGLIGDAQDALRRVLNVSKVEDWNRTILPTDIPDQSLFRVDADEGVRRAFQTRPEVKQAVMDIESKKLTYVYNRNQLMPRLDLSASYGLAGVGANATVVNPDGTTNQLAYSDALTSIGKADFPAWTAGLVFNIPIFNRVARGNAAIAATDLELSRANLNILKLNLAVEVRAAARSVDTAYRAVLAFRKGRELAERNLDAEQKKYENGLSTSFQVAQLQNDLTTARTQELLAIAAYRKSITAWYRSTGDLLKVKNIVLPNLPVTIDPTAAEEGAVR
jgi:outer membrane protein TolC